MQSLAQTGVMIVTWKSNERHTRTARDKGDRQEEHESPNERHEDNKRLSIENAL